MKPWTALGVSEADMHPNLFLKVTSPQCLTGASWRAISVYEVTQMIKEVKMKTKQKKILSTLIQPPEQIEQTEWLPLFFHIQKPPSLPLTLSVRIIPSVQCCGRVFLQPTQAEGRPVLYSAGSRKTAKRNFIIMLSTWHIIGAQ